MDYELITPRYTHWRTSIYFQTLTKGKPEPFQCTLYSRSRGWYGNDKRTNEWMNQLIEVGARGGATLCQLVDQYGNTLAAGVAVCSFSDNFCYATGRTLAAGRALQALGKLIEEIRVDYDG